MLREPPDFSSVSPDVVTCRLLWIPGPLSFSQTEAGLFPSSVPSGWCASSALFQYECTLTGLQHERGGDAQPREQVCWILPLHGYWLLWCSAGPIKSEGWLPVLSGASFDWAVRYLGAASVDEVTPLRLRIYPVPSDQRSGSFNCASQDATREQPFMRFSEISKPPDEIVTRGENYYEATWRNLSIVIDGEDPERRPGEMFAICFCDGGQSDCSVSESYFIQIGSVKVAGELDSECFSSTPQLLSVRGAVVPRSDTPSTAVALPVACFCCFSRPSVEDCNGTTPGGESGHLHTHWG